MSDQVTILLFGCTLIMLGFFGLVGVAMRARRWPVEERAQPAPRPAASAEYLRPEEMPAAERSVSEAVEDGSVTEIGERTIELSVVRDREVNPDGQPRQDILRSMQVGDPVVLVPEEGEAGTGEIRVVATGGTIGYVPDNKVAGLLMVMAECISTRSEVSYLGEVDGVLSAWIMVAVRT